LCEITYSPLGKRSTWRECAARLDIIIDELHRDRVPDAWGLAAVHSRSSWRQQTRRARTKIRDRALPKQRSRVGSLHSRCAGK
jgi:hypothetical protein